MTRVLPAADAQREAGRMLNGGLPPTEKQLAFVEALRTKLRLPKDLLDNHCVTTYRMPLKDLDKARVSRLIDELLGWEAIPADLERRRGQLDLL